MPRTRISAFLLFALVLLASCTVKQAVQSRNKAAEYTKGAEVSGGAFERTVEYEGKIRVYASKDYREARGGWQSQFGKMVREANEVLGPAFGVELKVVDALGWNPECDPSSLEACVVELAAYDPGDDVDWVVGLIAAVPRFTTTFEELGIAEFPGKHFILRDLYDPAEREAINDMFPAMAPSKKNEVYRERRAHKQQVILLHEWAHTLGAPHTRRDQMIMYPAYDSEMARFSEVNLRLIDASLTDRFPPNPAYPALVAYLQEVDDPEWWTGERAYVLSRLGAPAAPAPARAVALEGDERLLAGLSEEDRAAYAEAKSQLENDDVEGSWETFTPLLDRYPDSYAVQHFGCGLAMQVGDGARATEACQRAVALAGSE